MGGGGSENESRISGIGPLYKKRKTTNSVVAQPETANTVDPSPFQFKWTIDRFSKMNEKHLYSDVFEVGGYKWRVLTYPKGAVVMGYLSLYLELDSTSLPNGWSVNPQISMTIVNQITNKNSVRRDMQLQFKEGLSSWGFASFISQGELYDHYKGFLVNDTLVVEVTCSVAEKDIAEHLTKRLKREQEDKNKKNKEKAEAHLYSIIKVVRDEDLAEQIGRDIYFDLVDPDKVRSFHVSKKMTIKDFKKMLAKEFGIPARSQRLWYWSRRQNHTYRPSRPMKPSFEAAAHVGQFVNFPRGGLVELVLFLEVERGRDLRPIPLLKKRWGDILLFFKLYDPEKEELRYVGSLIVNWRNEKPSEILARLNKLADYEPDEEIKLYKEIAFEPNVICEHVDKKLTFEENKLENGGIICFQKVSAMDNVKHIRHPDVPSYLEYVHSGQIPLSPSDKESKDEESVEEQNENIIDQQTNVDKNIEAQQSKEDIETTYDDEGTWKSNTSKVVSVDLEEIDAMIDEDVIAAIDRVLSEGINISLKSQHSVQGQVSKLDPNLSEQLLQELRDITFKEDVIEKFKEGLTPEVKFKAVIDKINANASAFSSHQLEQVGVVVNLLNNIVRMLGKLHFLKKELDSAKKSTDQDNEALKEKRQKILTLKTSVTDQQTQLNSLDVEIADLEAKLKKRQVDRAKIAEIQDKKNDKITSLNKEVKSIFHRLADDQIKLKSVEDQIPKAQTELESHEKLYRVFKAIPPF